MEILYIKALHIIFVVTWFAGLFYIVRLFIYFAEAENEDEGVKAILQKQYKLMSKRLWYGITWPSAILTLFFASWLLYKNPAYLTQGWMLIKLAFVMALYIYHFMCHKIFAQQQKGIVNYSPFKLRIWNEVATVLLFAIVFLVILKTTISWIWGVLGIILFGIILMVGINAYKRIREKKEIDKPNH